MYVRHPKIRGFDNLTAIRDSRILFVLNKILGETLKKANEATQRRVRFLKSLKEEAEGNEIAIVYSGRDCDGVVYDNHYSVVEANKEVVEHETNQIFKYADGPIWHLQLMKPSMARMLTQSSRDLTLEAFEDGRPHCIHG